MPAWDDVAVDALARGLRLGIDPRRRRHGAGSRLGQGPGASLEFHDHRPYVPGDDLRHLDWGVLARSDQLMLRRYRVEVAPRFELLLDLSASMGVDPAKAALATGLSALLARLAVDAGARPRLWLLGDRPERIDEGGPQAWRSRLTAAPCSGRAGLSSEPRPELGAGSDRVLVSDGLDPSGAAAVLRRLAAGAGRICLVQVLSALELEPQPLGAVRLEDVEGGARDLVHDEPTCRAYRERLARHQRGWQEALSGRGAGLITCRVEDGLRAAVDRLIAAGLIEVAA
jgi:uncharacterized protein (DUF58 family)